MKTWTCADDKGVFGMKLHKTVVLVGMMGAGKTAIGKHVAQVLGVPFRDSDEAIVTAAQMSVTENFRTRRRSVFSRPRGRDHRAPVAGDPRYIVGWRWRIPASRNPRAYP